MIKSLLLFVLLFAVSLTSTGVLAAQAKDANPKDQGITGNFSVVAADGIKLRVAEYLPHSDPRTPLILLFHDGAMNRSEYRYIAPRLNQLGFNCMAPDLRAGKNKLGHKNKTASYARRTKTDRSILAARLDMEALLPYARSSYPEASIVLMGCASSAAHCLRLAGEMASLVDGVVAFSPAEFFAGLGKSETWIQEGMGDVHCPVLILSSGPEEPEWRGIYGALPEGRKAAFSYPEGAHGVRALASKSPGSELYWQALTEFLLRNYKSPPSTAGAATEQDPPEIPPVDAESKTLERMVVIGASVSMGFFLPANLAAMLEASCVAPHQKIRSQANGMFAWDSVRIAKEELAFAKAQKPSLLLAVDFLFWLGYGAINTRGEILTSEQERLELLDAGLALLDEFRCPIVVGDFPDMSHASGEGYMIGSQQLPRKETLALLNGRLARWAAKRKRVLVVPLAAMQVQMLSGESFQFGHYAWPAGSEFKVLQKDRLHPTLEGLGAITHSIIVSLLERGWFKQGDWNLDLAEVLRSFKYELKGVEPVATAVR